ncbi:hypothetical protein [Telluribacter humicola]|uniref:hypothetical protein n=1 Tax=Telluribacter humicola TaxID=1720261 RepID=UPI001A97A8B3|nr:hypothetical protein [Telluribacter humicola]
MKKVKYFTWAIALLALISAARAQDAPLSRRAPGLPINVSVFSESISLPDFKGFFRNPNLGVRVGTELYYRNRPNTQVFQTVNVGFYQQKGLHNAWFVSSELGYRKFFGNFYADATIGGGYLHLRSIRTTYEPTGSGDYVKVSPVRNKFMPTLGLGAGYRFRNHTAIFARYEVFGIMPIQQDVPVLPHKALHVGARLNINR